LFIDRETHRDGGLQSARAAAGQDKVEWPHVVTELACQGDTFSREV
jgi:hypothetical protein